MALDDIQREFLDDVNEIVSDTAHPYIHRLALYKIKRRKRERNSLSEDIEEVESLKRTLYTRGSVRFVPSTYLLRYKCTRCSHEWDDTWTGYGLTEDGPIQECRMGGCSSREVIPMLYRLINRLFTGKKVFGYGRLIESKKIGGKKWVE